MLVSVIIAYLGIQNVWSLDADLVTHCDNSLSVELSQDGGDTYQEIGAEDNWQNALSLTIEDVTVDTIVRFTCDDVGVVGGFIATMDFDGVQYSTTNPISDGNFELISSSDGITSPLVYSVKTSPPWNINTEGINDDAYWIWNGQTYNSMVFQFDFSNIVATPEPTPAPTSCFNSIDDWIIDELGSSSQFRYRSGCSSNQFLKIKMVSLIEYDEDGKATANRINSFAPNDWYWITNEDGSYDGYDAAVNKYVSSFNLNNAAVEFNLTTILFHEDGEINNGTEFDQNTLKWSTDINNWPFLDDENTLKLCIDVMTNGGKNKNDDEERDDFNTTRFTFNDFEFRLIDTATCGEDEVDVETYEYAKNHNHLDICFTFNACDDIIDHDPFVRFIGDDAAQNDEAINVGVISIGIGAALFILLLIAFVVMFYRRRNKKLQKDLKLIKDENGGYDTMITKA